jgi:hypothetical protein
MRTELIRALKAHATGHIAKHKANIEIYLKNPVGIGEHSDLIEAMEKELDEIARYHDQLEVISKYLSDKQYE